MIATDTHPKDIVAPVWIKKSLCIAYISSTHQWTMFSLYTISINGI